jgi:hypothetical protein
MSMAYTAGTPAARPRRHALGMPAGSIRALLAIGVLALLWVLALLPGKEIGGRVIPAKLPVIFTYLNMLMLLVVVHYFTAHGKSIGPQVSDHSPLRLPRGSVRFILIVGYLGLAYFLYTTGREFEVPQSSDYAWPLALMLTGYFLGHMVSGFMTRLGGGVPPAWYQDVEAWIALMAVIFLAVIVLVRLIINPTLPLEQQIDPEVLEMFLAAVVGFYFGARS